METAHIVQEGNEIRVIPGSGRETYVYTTPIASPDVTITACTKNEILESLEIHSRSTGEIRIFNNFRTCLLALSDDVSATRFDGKVQRTFCCDLGSYFPIPLEPDRVYHLSCVL